MPKLKDISGQKFGRLTAVERIDTDKRGELIWLCQCECGNTTKVRSSHLRNGRTKSCGCLKRERTIERNFKHGACQNGETTRLYITWRNMRRRCQDPEEKNYENYGGRGISVCEKWQDFRNFQKWAKNNGYKEDLEIDRIDNDGDYCPENCRWVTHQKQSNNKRTNRLIEFNGRVKTLAQWARELDIKYISLYMRLKRGWSVEKAFTEPINEQMSRAKTGEQKKT